MVTALALASNRSWTRPAPATVRPEADRLPLHCESMLSALGEAVEADHAALVFWPSRPGEPGRHLGVRLRDERDPQEFLPAVVQAHFDPSRDASGWIVESGEGRERTSHLCAVLWEDVQSVVQVELIRKAGARRFGTQDILTLRRMAPGMTLALRAVMGCVSSSLATDIFHRLPFGVAVLDSERRVVFQNAAMRSMLVRRDCLVSDRGVLCARVPAEQEALVRSVRQITSGEEPRGELMVVSRGAGESPYLVTVERFDSGFMGSTPRRPAVRLTLVDPSHSDSRAIARVAEHFGLTPTEIDVVQSMLLGLDVAGCAEHMGLAVNTVRWHQKRIFARTGTCGRAALILLFIRGSQLHGDWA